MRIRAGCELSFEFSQTMPMIVTLTVHFSRFSDLERPDHLMTNPSVPIEGYRDSFGNWCSRLVAPAGRFSLGTDAIVRDPGVPDPADLNALQHQVQHLPTETLLFLLGSRYCETDRLSDEAWRLFGHTPLGWPRVQAICDFVHNHITFGYEHSRATRTASEAYRERHGVCRDYAHLAVGVLPLPEHPGALLHRLHYRHRPSSAVRADGFCGVDRSLSRRPLARLRPAQQRPPDRAYPYRPRPRRRRCASDPHLRSGHLVGLSRLGRGGAPQLHLGDALMSSRPRSRSRLFGCIAPYVSHRRSSVSIAIGHTMTQDTDAHALQDKAEARLASLKEEKLVTRIAVLSTLLGQGKTTKRLMIGMSIETHKTSPDFDQKKCSQAKSRIMQALGDIDCDVFIEMDR